MDLWVLPQPTESKWFARLDWYLNWQMSKGLAFERSKPPVELFRVLEDFELPYEIPASGPVTPLLVISRGRLPTQKCVVIPSTGTLKTWLSEVEGIAAKLQAHKLRVFLPRGSKPDEALKIWSKFSADKAYEIQFSADEDAL